MWRCNRCAAIIDDVFDACWKCGTSKDGIVDPGFCHADSIEVQSLVEPSRPQLQEPDAQEEANGLLFRAYGLGILGGVVAAGIGVGLGAAYGRSLPPAPDYGGIREDIVRTLEAAIGGALIGGNVVFLLALVRFSLLKGEIAKRIGCAWAGLAATLVIVGGVVWLVAMLALSAQG